jgi:multimeric flavodoxin WrbA
MTRSDVSSEVSTDVAPNGLLIVWHSRTGASEQMAHNAYQAALEAEPALAVRILRCDQADDVAMKSAAAYLFVCPENLATMSGAMKEFFDQNYYPLLDQISGRAYACIVCAGSDGAGAVRQVTTIATGWRLKQIQEPIIVNTAAQSARQILAPKTLDTATLARAHETGAAMASGLVLGIF